MDLKSLMKSLKDRRVKLVLFGAAAVLLVCLWSLWIWHKDIEVLLAELSVYFRDSVHFLDGVPLICYSFVIFILPIFFLPVTPIFILASARPESYIAVLGYCWLGVTLNIAVSYFISRKFGIFLRLKLSERGINIPDIPPYEQYELTFLMRMIPGNPLAVQNYVLGAANIPFDKYVLVSLPIQYIQIAAYVYFGEGVFEGGLSKLMLGTSILLVIAVIARMLDKRYGYKLRGAKKDGISKTK